MVPATDKRISYKVNSVVNIEKGIEECRQHQSGLIGHGSDAYSLRLSRLNCFLCHGEFSDLRKS